MPVLDAKKLLEQLKNRTFANAYCLYGSDVLQVEACVKKILKAVTGSEHSDGVTKMEGGELDCSELADEAQLCPMFSDYNLILIHDCNLETQREDVRKSLLEIVKTLPPATILVFYATGFDMFGGKTGKNKKPTAKNKPLVDLIAKNGVVCCCEPKTAAAMAAEIAAAVKRRGCSIERKAAQELAELCDCQQLLVKQELGKLCAYAGGGEITSQMIGEMVTPQLETTVYALTNAVIRRRPADAMRAVNELLSMQTEMPYLMASVSGSLVDMQRACAAIQAGKTVDDVMNDFSYRFRFMVENTFRDSSKRSMSHITRCLTLLCRAEQQMYSGAVDGRVLFEKTIVEMLQG